MSVSRVVFTFSVLSIWFQSVYGYSLSKSISDGYVDWRRYDEVTWLTSHNAFASKQEGWRYAQQELSVEEQFALGVRAFMLDVHWCKSTNGDYSLAMAHGDGVDNSKNYSDPAHQPLLHGYIPLAAGFKTDACRLSTWQRVDPLGDTPHLEPMLTRIKVLLEKNRSEIITIHLESYLGISGSQKLSDLFKRIGIERYIYHKPSLNKSEFPMLGELRALDQRLVIFSSNPGDVSLESGIIDAHFYRETEYNLDKFSACEMRSDRDTTKVSSLFVLNHFYGSTVVESFLPFSSSHSAVNSFSSIMERVMKCRVQEGRLPNFLAVDFVEKGTYPGVGAREAVLALNLQWLVERQPTVGFINQHPLLLSAFSVAVTALALRFIPYFRQILRFPVTPARVHRR